MPKIYNNYLEFAVKSLYKDVIYVKIYIVNK